MMSCVALSNRFGAWCCRLDNNRNWSENLWIAWRWWLCQPNWCHTQHIGTLLVSYVSLIGLYFCSSIHSL